MQRTWGERVLFVVLPLFSVGIAAFWVYWFVSGDYENAGTPAYRAFENTFPLPDGVLSLLLFAVAYLILRRSVFVVPLGAFAAGMLFYLASLDAWFSLQHRVFVSSSGVFEQVFIVLCCYTIGICLFVSALRTIEDAAFEAAKSSAWPLYAVAGMWVLYAVATVCYLAFRLIWAKPLEDGDIARVFHDAFPLADAVMLIMANACVFGVVLRRRWAVVAGWATSGGACFGSLNYAAFTVLNPHLVSDVRPFVFVSIVVVAGGALASAAVLWERRGLLH